MENNKVSISLGFEPHQMSITSKGINFGQEFRNILYDKEEEFRSKIILEINEFAGDNWYLQFTDYRTHADTKFIVNITVSNQEFLPRIVNIITTSFPEIEFSFYSGGQHSPFAQTQYFMYERSL